MAGAWLWRTAFLLSAGFILLSGSEAARRCYWCGPLAEQVHRSRRSAPCGASDHVTVCEPGYDYCAVVATSPPRVESRYCVKMYQDECYPLYCNSTKTWKMTCPCRGDLCNGANTERETEAFAILPKLVAKTHNARIKKRTANAAPHLIKHDAKKRIIANADAEIHNISSPSSNNDNKLIVTENDVTGNMGSQPTQLSQNMQSDQPTNIVIEHHNEENNAQSTVSNQDNVQATTLNSQLIEIEILVSDPTDQSKTMKENEQPCTDMPTTTQPDENQNTELVKGEVESIVTTTQSESKIEPSMKTTEIINVAERETVKPTEVVPQVATDTTQPKPSDKPHTESPTKIMPNDQPADPLDQMQNDAPPMSPTDSVQSLKTTDEMKNDEASTKDIVKTSGIPTAESLQQNGNPPVSAPTPVTVTEKPYEPTTIETVRIPTISTTLEQMTQMTTPPPHRKNNALQLSSSCALLTISLVLL